MVPSPDFLEIIVIRIEQVPSFNKLKVHFTKSRQANMKDEIYSSAQSWFHNLMFMERLQISAKRKIKYTEWKIRCNKPELLHLKAIDYTNCIIVLGQVDTHWAFYEAPSMLRIQRGFGPVRCNYCPCCIQDQYIPIVNAVKAFVDPVE